MKKGLIVVLDALGVRSLKSSECRKFITRWQSFRKKVDSLRCDLPENIPEKSGIMVLGDMLVFYWEKEKVEKHLHLVSDFLSEIIVLGLKSEILLRGAIGAGSFILDENIIVGPAVFDALNYQKNTEWMGLVASKKTSEKIEKLQNDLLPSNFIMYNVSLKNDCSEALWVVSWPWKYLENHNKEDLSISLKKNNMSKKAEHKFKNTMNFFDVCTSYLGFC